MAVEVNDLYFSYGKHEVLKGISFEANRGQMMAVLGGNGAGKSTLFKCLLNLRSDYKGSIKICHKDIKTLKRNELSRMIAYVPQSTGRIFDYTVLDTVLMGTTAGLDFFESPKREQIEAAEEALEMLNIKDLANRGISEISGGEMQLVLIARAMVQKAKVLVMDEPTASLDYGNQHMVMEMARKLADETYVIIMSTHNPEQALSYATDILALKAGRILENAPAVDIKYIELIKELYGVEKQNIFSNAEC